MSDVRVIAKPPEPLSFGYTGGTGSALVINSGTSYAYYYKKGVGITPISDPLAARASYGGMSKTVNQAIGTLGAAYQTVATYTVLRPSAPVNVTPNLTAGSLTFGALGVYQLNVDLALLFNEDTGGRSYNARLYNLTAGAVLGDILPVAVGRNTAGSTLGFGFLGEVALLNQQIVFQIGGGDTFANTIIATAGLYASRVSP